jgi:hypothetical protein
VNSSDCLTMPAPSTLRCGRTARYRKWREVERGALDWASRSLRREFEEVILVDVLIEAVVGSHCRRPTDYERAVVVDTEVKTNNEDHSAEWLERLLTNELTGPTLFEMSDKPTAQCAGLRSFIAYLPFSRIPAPLAPF